MMPSGGPFDPRRQRVRRGRQAGPHGHTEPAGQRKQPQQPQQQQQHKQQQQQRGCSQCSSRCGRPKIVPVQDKRVAELAQAAPLRRSKGFYRAAR